MVKYLNNRRQKSRNNRQQMDGSNQQTGGTDSPGQNTQGQGSATGKNVVPQDEPARAVLSSGWGLVKRVLTYQHTETDDTFSLGGRRSENPASFQDINIDEGQSPKLQGDDQTKQGSKQQEAPGQESEPSVKQHQGNQGASNQAKGTKGGGNKGQTSSTNAGQGESQGTQVQPPPNTAPFFQQNQSETNYWQRPEHHTRQGGTPPREKPVPVEQQVHFDLDKNLAHVKRIFNIPTNKGFTIREFLVGFGPGIPGFVLFTEGLADKNIINKHILEPLMILSSYEAYDTQNPINVAKERLVSANQVEQKRNFIEIIEAVLTGSTALFIEGSNAALLIETKGWEHRGIGRPQVENVVRGPQEGFNELLISNVALVRSRLRTENLMSEMYKIGRLSKADVAVMYIQDIANPAIVNEVRKRLNVLQDVDYIPDTGILEQFIEDSTFSPMPQMLSTERPDRVAAYLCEGYVAILMSSTPFALVVPVTFWGLLHSAEDIYVRWPYGGLMRIVRVIAVLIAMFFPAIYIAIVNFHHSMLPPDILYAIAAARERVPFPAIVEILLMEISFELIREAGIRIPSIIGATIGIVGALILGQAAVQANLISPLVIIIVALTGLSSFAIPNYNLSFQVRIIRFIYIAIASVGGFFAIATFIVAHMAVLSSVKSFGMPILTPAAPNRPSKDTVFRGPLWTMENRPKEARPLKEKRQPAVARAWSPNARRNRGEQND